MRATKVFLHEGQRFSLLNRTEQVALYAISDGCKIHHYTIFKIDVSGMLTEIKQQYYYSHAIKWYDKLSRRYANE